MSGQVDSPSASQLRDRSLELLEFPLIREALSRFTQMPVSRERALTLEPARDAAAVEQLQAETAEASEIIGSGGGPDLTLGVDPRPLLARSAMQGVLAGAELIAVADALDLTRRAKSVVGRSDTKFPVLRSVARHIVDLRPLEKEIRSKISPSGEVLDNASSYLRQLRSEAREAYRKATGALERIIDSDTGHEVLQDSLYTVRSDRLVLPVKTDFRGRLPGIVHGVSDSGATLFVEPMSNVRLTNSWREAQAKEEEEVLRILRDLSISIMRRVGDVNHAVNLAARIDLALAKARYANSYQGCAIRTSPSPGPFRLVDSRHPLIGRGAVPVSLSIAPPALGLVVTGPNTGGKTVALKTLGLLTLMHQAGLQLPCDASTELPVVDGVYADIGDQQSIAAAVSTFSSHIANIAAVIQRATPQSLVLLDELGTSTDPEEGSALARAIVAHLVDRQVPTMVTTHHRNVAAFAEQTEGLANASVELDPETLAPTYRLVMGLPGRSYAMAVAERIGLHTGIVEAAKGFQDPEYRATEDLLATIQQERLKTRQRLDDAEEAQRGAARLARDLERQLQELEVAKAQVVEDVRRELQEEAKRVQARLRQAGASAEWAAFRGEPPPPRAMEDAREEVGDVQRLLRSKVWGREARLAGASPSFGVGDLVDVGSLGFTGKVLGPPDADQRVEVLVGSARIKMETSRLRKAGSSPSEPREHTSIQLAPARAARLGNPELDIRGMRLHEAMERLDDYLDDSLSHGLTQVRVIHGKGTGVLRQGVWHHLANHRSVEAFDFAPRERGGDGATEVTLS